MKLPISVAFAILLVFTGAPHPSWSDNSPKIVAYAGEANTLRFWETGESYIDDRIFVSFPLAYETGFSDSFPVAATFIRRSSEERNLTKKGLKIYKLTAAFLI